MANDFSQQGELAEVQNTELQDVESSIANLRAVLESGASALTEDGVTTTFRSSDEIVKQIRKLEDRKRRLLGLKSRRPFINSIDLS